MKAVSYLHPDDMTFFLSHTSVRMSWYWVLYRASCTLFWAPLLSSPQVISSKISYLSLHSISPLVRSILRWLYLRSPCFLLPFRSDSRATQPKQTIVDLHGSCTPLAQVSQLSWCLRLLSFLLRIVRRLPVRKLFLHLYVLCLWAKIRWWIQEYRFEQCS